VCCESRGDGTVEDGVSVKREGSEPVGSEPVGSEPVGSEPFGLATSEGWDGSEAGTPWSAGEGRL
jgi:hypothetical protein